ncbi:mitochondrial morphology and distribution, partial [Scheffersomyces stipitis CBS 6054]|uniref:mitochondrial morphology and distribution n=1 Tax=Scheffersomyces stipitis (strain ATCC 58785 / CBS 6054 / NBRC 10063 / NRRL Y-11545) TaxID=322104 RepID=UPI0001573C2D
MSFEINWENLTSDSSINESLKEFLDRQFQNISLPSYIANLSVTNFSVGDIPPEITIRHIGDPFDEFYEDENDEGSSGPERVSSNSNMNTKETNYMSSDDEDDDEDNDLSTIAEDSHLNRENDIQIIAEIEYSGNLHVDLIVNLLVNYPSPNFISLPIKLHITDIVIHSIATIAYLKKAVYFSFLCDINESTPDYFSTSSSSSRIDIVKKIKIESEIGELENNVLRNVGKVEKFLIEQLRNIIREELAWPSWICIDMSEDED